MWELPDAVGVFFGEGVEISADVICDVAKAILLFPIGPQPVEIGGGDVLHRNPSVFAEGHRVGVL